MDEQSNSMQIVEAVEALWGEALFPAGCEHCGTAHLVAERHMGKICPACANGTLTSQPARLRREPPEKLIPFQVQGTALAALFGKFVKGVWLRFDDFNVDTLVKRATPVFIPLWLVDSDISGIWQAERVLITR